jgi:hypothetical protein
MQTAVEGAPVSDLGTWKRSKLKKKLKYPTEDPMYGKASTDLKNYSEAFMGYHLEVDDPLQEEAAWLPPYS